MNTTDTLRIEFSGKTSDRAVFLTQARLAVMDFIGERMTLDAIIYEMVKNIYDHANGHGILEIHREGDYFHFRVSDRGDRSYDFEVCFYNSTKVGNGINHGIGLGVIMHLSEDLKINLAVDTSRGFTYSGTYRRRHH